MPGSRPGLVHGRASRVAFRRVFPVLSFAALTLLVYAGLRFRYRPTRPSSAVLGAATRGLASGKQDDLGESAKFLAGDASRLLLASHTRVFWYSAKDGVSVLHEGQVQSHVCKRRICPQEQPRRRSPTVDLMTARNAAMRTAPDQNLCSRLLRCICGL